MTAGAIAGVLLFDLFLLAVGMCLVFGLRGWHTWGEVWSLAGFAYLVGVATTGLAFTAELVAGLELSLAAVLGTGGVLAVAGLTGGFKLGRPLPRVSSPSIRRLSLLAAIPAALSILVLEALFRAGRLEGLFEFDAWSFWVPKAKAIYYYGGLDGQFFGELPGPSYPPLVPAHEAAVFQFLGSADVVTLHLFFWSLLVGFVWAAAGLLAGRAPPVLVWPSLLLLLVTPHVLGYAVQAQADFLLDELLGVAGLLVGLWLIERHTWQLVSVAVLLGAAMSTKREGYLLSACLLVAALVASVRELRAAWPRLVLMGAAAVAVTLPWRIHLASHDLSGGGPEAGGFGLFSHLGRAWPSLRLAASTIFDYDIWLVVAPVAILAVALALLAGAGRIGVYAGTAFVLLTAGFTWITWSFPSLPITKNAALNPIVRVTGALMLLAVALTPLLLSSAWGALSAQPEEKHA